ncbi:hypothetical protein [Polymorphospora rubra]|uniref:hypothetical protein n=1 Tax=Polymorphospora rubra TaxID=338584 RepID=UPI0033FBBBEC
MHGNHRQHREHPGALRQLQVSAAVSRATTGDPRREADLGALDPAVWGTEAVRTCSVCAGPVDRELHQVWISRLVGTDVLPLLVNACSTACLAALPEPHSGYVPTPHTGGPAVVQPAGRW